MTTVLSPVVPARRAEPPTSPLRVAIIGCGAIAETYHLPALARHARLLGQVVLVDPDLSRAHALAATLREVNARIAESHEDVWDDIDAAIIATPPRLHARIAMPLLARGVHVLCEKPLAESTADAMGMIEQAARSGAWLCVNQTRRASPALRRVKELLRSGAIGECVTIEHTEGFRFAWPSVSGWHFARGHGARGVLLDQGAHVLDTICWWLGEEPRVLSCRTDSFGGPEGVVSIVLQRGACTITITLSWLSQLSNRYRLVGTHGVIEGSTSDVWRFTVAGERGRRRQVEVGAARCDYRGLFGIIVDNFLDAVRGHAVPLVPGTAALPSIHLMDECYRSASRMSMPWLETLPDLHVQAY